MSQQSTKRREVEIKERVGRSGDKQGWLESSRDRRGRAERITDKPGRVERSRNKK